MLSELLDPARLFRTALMVGLGLVAIFVEAAPLGLMPGAPPSPDILLCVLLYWSIRRPGSTPLAAVFALGLIRDFLTDLPVGAGTLTLIVATEVFKARRRQFQRANFLVEWIAVGLAALASATVLWTMVMLTLSQPPYVMDLVHQCLYTAMLYPFVVLIFRWVLRITWRKAEYA